MTTLSQIGAYVGTVNPGDFLVSVTNGNTTDSRVTCTQATQALAIFSSTAKGVVPASGGGLLNYLRADGTWATILTPSGVNVQGTAGSPGQALNVTASPTPFGIGITFQPGSINPSAIFGGTAPIAVGLPPLYGVIWYNPGTLAPIAGIAADASGNLLMAGTSLVFNGTTMTIP